MISPNLGVTFMRVLGWAWVGISLAPSITRITPSGGVIALLPVVLSPHVIFLFPLG